MTIQRRRRLIRQQRSQVGLALVAAIAFLAGMTDAIGLMTVGDFVSFMSGNTTRASVALAGGDLARGLLLVGGLVAFVIGNALGVVVALRLGTTAVLLAVALLLAAAALSAGLPAARFLLMVLAMGSVNAAVEQVEGLPVGLTYVTGALSRFGRGLGRRLMGRSGPPFGAQIVPWAGMFAGAVGGAILARYQPQMALFAPVLVAALLALAVTRIPRHWASRFLQR